MRIFFFISLFLWFGCGQEMKKNYRLTDEQLVSLMLDLQLTDVVLPSVGPSQQDTLKKLFWKQFSSIYKMSPEEIESEVKLLQSDPEKLKIIMDRVKMKSDSLELR